MLRARTSVRFEVLNARHHEREAAIVAQAGVPGAITIATNMAGRGTDIQLGGNVEMKLKEVLTGEETPEQIEALKAKFKNRLLRTRKKFWPAAACIFWAPSVMKAAVLITSCAAVPVVRATPEPPNSSFLWKMT